MGDSLRSNKRKIISFCIQKKKEDIKKKNAGTRKKISRDKTCYPHKTTQNQPSKNSKMLAWHFKTSIRKQHFYSSDPNKSTLNLAINLENSSNLQKPNTEKFMITSITDTRGKTTQDQTIINTVRAFYSNLFTRSEYIFRRNTLF